MLPLYDLDIDPESGLIMDKFSFVKNPAHMKKAQAFNGREQFFANDDLQEIMGVMIQADVQIYRRDEEGEYFVRFPKDTVRKVRQQVMEEGYNNFASKYHSDADDIEVVMTDSFIIDSRKGIGVPDKFKDQNINEGSWMASFYIKDRKEYEEIRDGKYGMSIEGIFEHTLVEMHRQAKLKRMHEFAKTKVRG